MKLLIYSHLIVATYLFSQLCAAPVNTPTNHQIFFEGMQHGYGEANKSQAILELSESLRNVTGYENVTIDSLDDQGAMWHIEELNQADGGCPREKITDLLSKIKTERGFTRPFKLAMSELFSRPLNVRVDWLGVCENQDRKRSQIIGESTPTTTAATDAGLSMSDTFQETGSSESIGVIITTTTPEPLEPKTTTEAPTTTIAPEIVESNTIYTSTTLKDKDFSTFKSLFDSDTPFLSPFSNETQAETEGLRVVDPTTTTTTTTTVPPPVTNSTLQEASSTSEPTTSPAPTTTSPPPAPTTTTTTTTAAAAITTTSVSSSDTPVEPIITDVQAQTESSKTEPIPEATATTTTPTTTERPTVESDAIKSTEDKSLQLSLKPATEEVEVAIIDSSRPHYGKYIGLGGGFLIVLAYLVCTRAYKRQGMYELQQNTNE